MLSFTDAFAEMPLIAIVRGVRPEEVLEVAEALLDGGIRIVEVPLNSPEPLVSMEKLSAMAGQMVWGAGTVLNIGQVDAVVAAGGTIIVAPNTDVEVIRRSLDRGAVPLPGIATATEAFTAFAAGARGLKLFPAGTYGPEHFKALSAVLPQEATLIPVGGVSPANMKQWWSVGARGFGLGSDLYKPGVPSHHVRERAREVVEVISALRRDHH